MKSKAYPKEWNEEVFPQISNFINSILGMTVAYKEAKKEMLVYLDFYRPSGEGKEFYLKSLGRKITLQNLESDDFRKVHLFLGKLNRGKIHFGLPDFERARFCLSYEVEFQKPSE